jgi:hypothetical protein
MRDVHRRDTDPRPPRLAQDAERLCREFYPGRKLFVRWPKPPTWPSPPIPGRSRPRRVFSANFQPRTGRMLPICATAPVPPDFARPGLADRPFDPRETASKEQWADLPDGGGAQETHRHGLAFGTFCTWRRPGLETWTRWSTSSTYGAAGHFPGLPLGPRLGRGLQGARAVAGRKNRGRQVLPGPAPGARGLDLCPTPPPGPAPVRAPPAVRPGKQPGSTPARPCPTPAWPGSARARPLRYDALPRRPVGARTQIRRGHLGLLRPGRFRLCARLCAWPCSPGAAAGGTPADPRELPSEPESRPGGQESGHLPRAPPGGRDHDPEGFRPPNRHDRLPYLGGVVSLPPRTSSWISSGPESPRLSAFPRIDAIGHFLYQK